MGRLFAAGLAAGFVEPLEATAIYSIEMTARWFMMYFPDQDIDPVFSKRFNKVMDRQYEDILNFIVMNYYTSNRPEPFWKASRNDIVVPDALRENLELWEHTMPGPVDTDNVFLFTHWNYLYIMLQKGYFEGKRFPGESMIKRSSWDKYTRKIAQAKAALVKQLPNHYDLLTSIRNGRSGEVSKVSLGATSVSRAIAKGDRQTAGAAT